MVPSSVLLAATACSLVLAGSQHPSVQIPDGTVIGFTNNSVENFLGIPYADTPERLRPPQRLSSPFGSLNATAVPASCPQHPLIVDPEVFEQLPPEIFAPLAASATPPPVISEDCLNLIIQRPSSTTPDSKLPVLFWIYGGGFATGSSVGYDYSTLIQESVALGQPILVVMVNYRVGAFGFLGGKELQSDGSTNLGLRDQRLALEWVSENIAAFGGDPDKVTIWGESAGSLSVMYQALINKGDNTYQGKPLFRGGIMNSGALFPAEAIDSHTAQGIFDIFSAATGCGSEDALTCLRELPYEEYLNATAAIPGLFGPEGFRLSFPPRPDPTDDFFSLSPEKAAQQHKIAPVPFISGNQDDEGTMFALPLLNDPTSPLLVKQLKGLFHVTKDEVLERMISFYPVDPAAGSPFNTGSANQLYPSFKRNAAVLGDLVFQFQKRASHIALDGLVPIWDFMSNYSKVEFLGTAHASDLTLLQTQQPSVPYKAIVQYYVNFINSLDPNVNVHGKCGKSLPHWPKWDKNQLLSMHFLDNATIVAPDDDREEAFKYFSGVQSELLY
ncbi:unnamed protein product [Clonostachys rosea]|uniref:Carboxylic ester hydrolase n=1 Tax=Bionectria ochroleuca TaxID=29856 RepID=A0ABY6TTA2_BIOOC|nr:unnamed protein product [Clonostachys rosea]